MDDDYGWFFFFLVVGLIWSLWEFGTSPFSNEITRYGQIEINDLENYRAKPIYPINF